MALPNGYTRLEYIQSTGTQYIDTGVIPSTNDFSIVMKVAACVTSEENWFLTVNHDKPEDEASFLQFGVRGNSTFATHLTYVVIDGSTPATTDVVDITFTVRGDTATQTGDATHTMTEPKLQSGSYRNGTITILNGNWRCDSCQIYIANTLVRDYVPCKNSSGVVGLYDLVNNVFYNDAAGGTFVSDFVPPLPDGYTRLEYIQSTGTQYIDTGFKPNQNTRLVLDFENTGDYSSMTTALCPLFGARNASAASSASAFGLWIGSKSYPHYGNVAYNANGNFTIDLNARLTYEMNKNVVSIGSEVITCSSATFTTNYNLCLLTINNYGTIETRRASGKLWAAKIYDNGTLVRDFIPCKNASGTIGLYDRKNGVFYSNKGSGTFTAGAEVLPSYKLVDANELDEAIGATADAIREKTGDSAPIAWDATRGFADAIPSGTRVATGSFEITSWVKSLTGSGFTLSGLPFKPSKIIIYYDGLNNSNGGYTYSGLYTINSSGWALGIHNDPYYDEELEEDVDYYCWWHYFIKNAATGGWADYLIVELTDDGVKLYADTSHEYADEMRLIEGVYNYIAFS